MHWDLFRLKNADEIESVGFWDQFLEREYLFLLNGQSAWARLLCQRSVRNQLRLFRSILNW